MEIAMFNNGESAINGPCSIVNVSLPEGSSC